MLAIECKGGKCQLCGYQKYQGALELNHIKKEEKTFTIGEKGYTRSWEKEPNLINALFSVQITTEKLRSA